MKKWLKKLSKLISKKSFTLALLLSDVRDLRIIRDQLADELQYVDNMLQFREKSGGFRDGNEN